jgi:hypothetical protein
MPLESDAILLLRERYGYMRAEILQRLDNRYKLLTAFLTLITVGFTVVYQLEWYAVGFPLCASMLAMAVVLQGENRHVRLISDYLILLERQLDAHYALETKGWERTSRSKRGSKPYASNRLTIGGVAFLTFFYLIFDLIGVRWLLTTIGTAFAPSEWVLISFLASGVAIPLILFLVFVWIDYRRFWKNSAR